MTSLFTRAFTFFALAALPSTLCAQALAFSAAQLQLGPALSTPLNLAVDPSGNLYVAVSASGTVIRIPAQGGPQTVISSGLTAPSGVALDASRNVFIATRNDVYQVTPAGVQTTLLTGLSSATGIAVGTSGNVYVCDQTAAKIIKLPAGGGVASTFASGLQEPTGVAVDKAGNVYVSDTQAAVVYKYTAAGARTTVAKGFSQPSALTVDSAGDIFVTDTRADQVYELLAGSGLTTAISPGRLTLNAPRGVAIDTRGEVFDSDSGNNRVLQLQASGPLNFRQVNVCPSGQGSPAPCSQTAALNFNVTTSGTLGTPRVLTQGAPNLDFTLASGSSCTGAVIAGNTCTVNVTFAPRYPGIRPGAVEVVDSSGKILATTYIVSFRQACVTEG